MADTLCRLEVDRSSGIPVARIWGEVDISNVEFIEAELQGLTGRERLFVIDLSDTEYFDSAGIRMLFALANRFRTRRQELRVVAPLDAIVRRVLEISDFVSVVPVHATLDEAIAST